MSTPTRIYPDWRETWPASKPPFTSPTGRPTPKWKGISLTAVRERQLDVTRAASAIATLHHVMNTVGQQSGAGARGLRARFGAARRAHLTRLGLANAVAEMRTSEQAASEALRAEVSALMHQQVSLGHYFCDDSPTGRHLFDQADLDRWNCLICAGADAPDK